MSELSLWIISTEVRPLDGADAPDWCVGAYVEAYVAATDIVDGITRVRAALESEKYEVVDVSQALRYDPDDFEADEPVHELAQEAVDAQGAVVYGPFEGWATDGVRAQDVGEA